jgi:hypothetical protein
MHCFFQRHVLGASASLHAVPMLLVAAPAIVIPGAGTEGIAALTLTLCAQYVSLHVQHL